MTENNAIITKYRPQKFEDVIGQEAVVRALENAVEKDLTRTYMFIGPSGVGKTTLARITARMLGCDQADLDETDGATETGVEDVRRILDKLMYRPMGEKAIKGIIVDEFHMLSKNAMQALLKSTEDPPPWVRWFFCTTDDHKIPKALRTRSLTLQLKEVRNGELIKLLKETEEGEGLDPDIIELCADEAFGSPRQALSNLAACAAARDLDEAQELLRSASEVPAAFELAQALMKGASWKTLMNIIGDLKETNPESVRHVVRAYMTSVLLKSDKPTGYVLDILEAFSTPFNSSDGMSPLLVACGKVVDIK